MQGYCNTRKYGGQELRLKHPEVTSSIVFAVMQFKCVDGLTLTACVAAKCPGHDAVDSKLYNIMLPSMVG